MSAGNNEGAALAAPAYGERAAAPISKFEAAAQMLDASISKFEERASDLPIAKSGGDTSLANQEVGGFQNPAIFAGSCQKADCRPPAPHVYERGRPAAGVSWPSKNTREMTACEDASIANMPAVGHSSADENILHNAHCEQPTPRTKLGGRSANGGIRPSDVTHEGVGCDFPPINNGALLGHASADVNAPASTNSEQSSAKLSVEGPSAGRNLVESLHQSESDISPQQNHGNALHKHSQAGRVLDNAPSALGFLDSAVAHPLGISDHKASRNGELKGRPAPVRPGAGLLRNTVHALREIESLDVASRPAPENHTVGAALRDVLSRWRDGHGFNEDSDEDVALLERADKEAEK